MVFKKERYFKVYRTYFCPHNTAFLSDIFCLVCTSSRSYTLNMNKKSEHMFESMLVIGFAILFLILFYIFRFDKNILKALSLIITLFYVSWGIIHSAREARLAPSVVLEYLLFGLTGYSILYLALSF